jgi:Integrin alpha
MNPQCFADPEVTGFKTQSGFSSSRSRPVVRVSATVELEAPDGKIDPENRTCSLNSGTKVACLSLQGCLLYEGEAVTEELGEDGFAMVFGCLCLCLCLCLCRTI